MSVVKPTTTTPRTQLAGATPAATAAGCAPPSPPGWPLATVLLLLPRSLRDLMTSLHAGITASEHAWLWAVHVCVQAQRTALHARKCTHNHAMQ